MEAWSYCNSDDACQFGLSCPVTKGSNQELKFNMAVPSGVPKLKVTVRVEVVDSNGILVCTQFPGQIA